MRNVKFLSLVAVFALSACGPKVATIDLTPATVELGKKGDSKAIVATAKDAENKKVEGVQIAFASADPKVATVDATGKVTAVDSGDAKITATFEQITASAMAKVSIPATISFAPAAVKLEGVGAKTNVVAKVLDGKGREVKIAVAFASADAKVATVAGTEVTAVAAGETTINAAAGEAKGSLKVTVEVPVVATVEVEKAVEIAKAGETAALKPAAKTADGKDVPGATFTYASADEKIAKVENGTVTAVKKGKTKITVTSGDKSATVEVSVKK